MRLHLAFLREEGGPLAVEGACVHNEILCSDNRRKLHKIYYTVRTVGDACPYKFVGICSQDRRRELQKIPLFRAGDRRSPLRILI